MQENASEPATQTRPKADSALLKGKPPRSKVDAATHRGDEEVSLARIEICFRLMYIDWLSMPCRFALGVFRVLEGLWGMRGCSSAGDWADRCACQQRRHRRSGSIPLGTDWRGLGAHYRHQPHRLDGVANSRFTRLAATTAHGVPAIVEVTNTKKREADLEYVSCAP